MTIISSTFDTGTDGWRADSHSFTNWSAEGGDPGGFLAWQDKQRRQSIASYVAPREFRGDLSEFLGGKLSYDIFNERRSENGAHRGVTLSGANGVTLYADAGLPADDWTHFAFRLKQGSWRIGSASGEVATKEDIAGVLHHVTRFTIQADYGDKVDSGGLDNVILVSKDAALMPAFGPDRHTVMVTEAHPGWMHDTPPHFTAALV